MLIKLKQLVQFTLAQLNSKISDADVPPDTRDIATTEGIQGGGDLSANRTHKLDINGLTVDATPDFDTDYVATYDASGVEHKKVLLTDIIPASEIGPRSGIEQSFFTSSTPYIENTGSAKVIADFVYRGTDVFTPTSFKIIGSRNSSSGTATVEIYDFTNAVSISTINFTAIAEGIYSTATITNLPTGEAIFQVRISSTTQKVRCHYVAFR